MSLADYEPIRASVEFKGGSLQVRGLALDDIALLMRGHLDDLNPLVDLYMQESQKENDISAMAKHIIALVREAPGLVANMIAMASDEPDLVDKARTLPMAVQIKAVQQIGVLTFEEAGGPKKFVESLIGLVRSATPARNQTVSLT